MSKEKFNFSMKSEINMTIESTRNCLQGTQNDLKNELLIHTRQDAL